MSPLEVGRAVTMILDNAAKPTALYVRRMPNATRAEVTKMIPVGRANAAFAGLLNPDMTVRQIREALNKAEQEMLKGRAA